MQFSLGFLYAMHDCIEAECDCGEGQVFSDSGSKVHHQPNKLTLYSQCPRQNYYHR